MALRKPSDLFDKKPEDLSIPIVDSDISFRDELIKVESLSDQITKLQQELSQKVVQTDLEKVVLSQITTMQENFEYLQNDFKKSNKKDIVEFKEGVSQLTQIVGNLVENELPKYKKQVTKNEVRIGEKFDELKEVVEENIFGIREELDTKVNNIAEVIDNNLEFFNNQLQETSFEVKKTTDTYNKLSKIVENRISKENEQLEEYSKVIQSFYEEFIELQNSLQEETFAYNQIIEEKFKTISSDVKSTIHSIDENVNNKINSIDEDVDTFKNQVSSDISSIKADVVIFEKHNKDTEKTIQEFSEQLYKISEIDTNIIIINEDIGKLQNQYDSISNQSIETKKDLEVVERYIQNHHHKLVELKEEVFGEIEQLPLGNFQENLERLEKKIDFIKETYSKIEPEVIVKEVIKEGLLNEPPNTKNSDPLTPLDQKFVTLDQLQEHYRLFINRIQQQLSTLGGGGETKLKYLDDIVGIATNASVYDGKFLKYDHSIGKFIFSITSNGGAGSQTLDDTLQLGNTSSLGMSVGVVTATLFYGTLIGYATTAGIATNSTYAGYATTAGVSTSVIGGIASVTQLYVSTGITTVGFITASNLYVSGVSTFGNALIVVGNLNVSGNVTVGGTSVILNAATLQIQDRDIVLGITTDSNNNDVSKDSTASHGGIAIASTEGTPLFNMPVVVGLNSNPTTYKQFMWLSSASSSYAGYSGLTTDAWISNYAIGIGTLTVRNGSRLTVGAGFTVYDTFLDALDIRVRDIKASGITTVGFITASNLYVSGISTFLNGRVSIGTETSTGTANQILQVSGGAYFSGIGTGVGIGTTNPTTKLDVNGDFRLRAGLYDVNNMVGSAGYVLVSTGAGVSTTGVVFTVVWFTGLIGELGLTGLLTLVTLVADLTQVLLVSIQPLHTGLPYGSGQDEMLVSVTEPT